MIDYQSARQILEQIGIHVLVTDDSLHIVEGSERTGLYLAEDANWLGRSLLDLAPELIGSEDVLDGILHGELPSHYLPMVNCELADGSVRYLNLTVLPHRGSDGVIDGVMYIVEDITDQAVIEQTVMQHRNELRLLHRQVEIQNLQLAAANAELRRLDEMKSRFVAIAAHELRSPLSTVNGYLDLLEDEDFGALTDQQTEFVAAIRRSTGRLLAIIDNLLDLTRIAAGRMDLVMSINDVAKLLAAAESELAPNVMERSLSLDLAVEEGLPLVLCDPQRIMQVLHNLILNAVKYTKAGGHVFVSATRTADPSFIQIAVKDDGIGIPFDDQDHIFESFFRAGNVYEVEAIGTGLGLNIARSLIELHGGEIRFESIPGQGSSFYITLTAVNDPSARPARASNINTKM